MSSPPADDGLWCRRFHPAPDAGERLVCFPHAGGSASFYLPVSAALSPQVDVVAVQYPGRQDRRQERGVDTIAGLADSVAEVLLGGWSDRPTTFFGHSMGALVAFEVARRLERHGCGLSRLFVSGRRAPSVHRDERLHLRDDDGLVAELRELSGTDSRVLGDDEMLRMILPAVRSDYKAVETYRGEFGARVDCPVTVLIGADDPKASVAEARAWDGHTSGAFDIRVFSGGHFYLTERAAEVMAVLTDHLTPTAAQRRA